jgi:hypothetical protein
MRAVHIPHLTPAAVRRREHYRQAAAGTNLVLIEPDLLTVFPDSEAVNRALRVLAEAAQAASPSKRRRVR